MNTHTTPRKSITFAGSMPKLSTIAAAATVIIATFALVANASPVPIQLNSGATMKGSLIEKGTSEIKLETPYGIVSLHRDIVMPESWALAQKSPVSKPSGNYVQLKANRPKSLSKEASETKADRPEAPTQTPYQAGFADGRIVGKHDAATGKSRDGQKAMRLGSIHAQSYPSTEDQKAYAKGYHEGYNDGWHQRNAYNKQLRR